ncbi:glycosyltransferase family 2 protein [Candidatus Harpocratesius sp.]
MEKKQSFNCIYSLVIPVYNSEKSIEELYEQILSVFEQITPQFEIIMVDDASKDNVWQKMVHLHEKDKRVKIIQLMRNYGKHNALLCGFNHASGEYIITLDDDLQNPPSEIPKLIKKMEETNADVVTGTRMQKHEPFFKKIASDYLDRLITIIFKKPRDLHFGAMDLIKRKIIDEIIKEKTPNPLLIALILKNTKNVVGVEIEHKKRKYGKSNYNLFKHLSIFYDLIINHSTIPLKLISMMGIFYIVFGFTGLIYIFINSLLGKYTVAGWASTIMLLLLIAGSLQFSLGTLGIYISRILNEVSYYEQFKINQKMV